jgi:hypothetical protein
LEARRSFRDPFQRVERWTNGAKSGYDQGLFIEPNAVALWIRIQNAAIRLLGVFNRSWQSRLESQLAEPIGVAVGKAIGAGTNAWGNVGWAK